MIDSREVGACAGAVWNFLNQKGKISLIQLKFELRCNATLLHLALGWLMKEGKIEFMVENGQQTVFLKS